MGRRGRQSGARAGHGLRARAGAIVSTDSNIWLPKQPTQEEKEALYKLGEKKVIAIALRAGQILAEKGI